MRCAALLALGLGTSACSITLPMFSTVPGKPEGADPAQVTGSVASAQPLTPRPRADAALTDHLGPEDLRRASGAMALALDPQGNGSPVNWDNAESRSRGRFTPVGGPFLRDDEVCRAFLTQLETVMDRHHLQGTACRPSGGEWSIRDLKPWRQPA